MIHESNFTIHGSDFITQLLLFLNFLANNVNISIFPVTFPQFDRTISDIFSVDFSHGANEVGRIFETNEAISGKIKMNKT